MSDQPVLTKPPNAAEIQAELEAMVVGDVPGVAPANFVGRLFKHLCPQDKDFGDFFWHWPPNGFKYRCYILKEEGSTPQWFENSSQDDGNPSMLEGGP